MTSRQPTLAAGSTQTREQVATYLATMAGWDATNTATIVSMLGDEATVRLAYREAAKRHHPDAGGNATTMAYITTARDHLLETMP